MRMRVRLDVAVIAVTTWAVLLQGIVTAQAVDLPAASSSEVLADIQDALEEVGAAPAVGMSRASTSAVEADLPTTTLKAGEAPTATGTFTMAVPAEGRDLSPRHDSTAVSKGTGKHTAVVVQATDNSVRALVHISSADAPERFEFPIGGDVASLHLTTDGGVEALDVTGLVIAVSPPPWAIDAHGTPVPTHYEVDGTTLVQVVAHHNGRHAYGVVADPFWSTTWKVTKCAAVLAANVFVATKLIKGLKGAWSFYEFAKLLVHGTFAREKLYAIAAGVIGIDTVVNACL